MTTIAVTGGIACGKTTLGRCLSGEGVSVCDADDLAHDAMAPGSDLLGKIVSVFGRDVVGEAGGLDRVVLGRRVFADEREREALNRLVHPEVRRRCREWVARQDRAQRVAAVIVPLLYEAGFDDEPWQAVVCVTASHEIQCARLAQRGLGMRDAEMRIASQMPVREKEKLADFVVVNNASLEILRRQVTKVLQRILEA